MNITFQNSKVTLEGTTLKVGDKFPDFLVHGRELNEIKLNDTKGKRIFLTVPSVDTGVCHMELTKFNQAVKDLNDVTLYSVSMDLPFALDRWCQANTADNVVATSDYKERSFGQATGTYIKELGLLTRAAFVVDANGTITHVEYVSEVANEPNYDAVLKAL